ncbi:MAG: AraC family transcriptional regulator [Proteobacteria bacterium HN_bin10]|nr:MAG: AraC family transcriptional regulator [Proteobacteria bacterium HN_bin10]
MSNTPPFPPKPKPRQVLIVIFPGFQILDAAGPIGALEIANRFAPDVYDIRLAASVAGMVASSSGIALPASALSGRARVDTFIVAGGNGTREAMHDAPLVRAIRHAPSRARRVASVCSGAFLLAQAGLLDGKRATTHWRHAAQLLQMFPRVRVDADRIHIKDGAIWTSAGVTAGIDLALAMIAEDLGDDIAASVAREMVVYAKRPGGQAQHSALLDLDASRFATLNAWMRERLHEDLCVERLAAQAAMSPRNFARAYAAETGVTPAKAVERLRAEAARGLLARGGAIEDIARRCGFGDPERMRRAFVRLYGAPPAAIRRTLRHA